MARRGTARHGTARHGTVRYGTVRYGMVCYHAACVISTYYMVRYSSSIFITWLRGLVDDCKIKRKNDKDT